LLSENVVLNAGKGNEVRPPVLTVMGCELIPVGTLTVSELVEAATTGTRTEPNQTTLAAGLALKLLPVMVTVVFMGPEAGAMELMTGWPNIDKGQTRATI
jgi:hypothetical protein